MVTRIDFFFKYLKAIVFVSGFDLLAEIYQIFNLNVYLWGHLCPNTTMRHERKFCWFNSENSDIGVPAFEYLAFLLMLNRLLT